MRCITKSFSKSKSSRSMIPKPTSSKRSISGIPSGPSVSKSVADDNPCGRASTGSRNSRHSLRFSGSLTKACTASALAGGRVTVDFVEDEDSSLKIGRVLSFESVDTACTENRSSRKSSAGPLSFKIQEEDVKVDVDEKTSKSLTSEDGGNRLLSFENVCWGEQKSRPSLTRSRSSEH